MRPHRLLSRRSGAPRRAAWVLGAGMAALIAAVAAPAGAGPAAAGAPPAASAAGTPQPAADTAGVPAYWLVASDGGIFAFGGAGFYGSTGGMPLNQPIVGMAGTPDSHGYWLVASDGGIFSFGDATFFGSTGAMTLNQPIVGMAPTPDAKGYWLVAADGGIFSFGDATFYGSTGSIHLNRPIVGMAPTPDGKGYWLVASDGGIFSFGDATFYGSTGAIHLNRPIVGMAASPDGGGYMLLASDGGIFTFGDVTFHGSLGGEPLSRPVVALAATPDGGGYWFTDNNGAVSAFGNAGYFGSAPQVLARPVVGMSEAAGTGAFGGTSYQSGSYGFDVSNYQCQSPGSTQAEPLPPGHSFGIVQVVGASFGATNSCLGAEARWAGAGLNLYIFLTYGTSGSGPASCAGDQACDFGFAAAQDAFAKAAAAGVDTQVTWWLDVENGPSWSSSKPENAQVVAGAIAGLRADGINTVGIYASPGSWNGIVGAYQPAVPYWMAWYQSSPSGPNDCANVSYWQVREQLPTGPVPIVQYQSTYDPGTGFAEDYDYAC